MLIAVWLLRMRPGLRAPDRILCNDVADRMRRFAEQREQYPGAEFLCSPSTETP